MVINQALRIGLKKLEKLEYGNPSLEARLILEKILNVDKLYLHLNGDKKIGESDLKSFFTLIDRRAQAYPLAYLLREKEFMGINFYIEEGVLIPRPDTEILVEHTLKRIKKKGEDKLKVLELGLGSGAIALSIGKLSPSSQVYGVDISPKAIKVSKINRERLGLDKVRIVQGDLFKPLVKDIKFDFILSNPPYIRRVDLKDLQKDVRDYEPHEALDGGIDGLDFYRKISFLSKDYLKENGELIFEIAYDQVEDVREILVQESYEHIRIENDLQGYNRVISGIMKGERNVNFT